MKLFIPVLLALLTFFAGCEPEVARVEATPEPKPKAQQAAKPTPDPGHIVCVECKGERFLMVRSSGSGANAEMRQSCPICSGKGFRDVFIVSGKKICPDCKGMGALMDTKRIISSLSSAGTNGATGRPGSTSTQSPFGAKVTCTRCTGVGLVFGSQEPIR
jgi:DnaJ-class molecular chaperone